MIFLAANLKGERGQLKPDMLETFAQEVVNMFLKVGSLGQNRGEARNGETRCTDFYNQKCLFFLVGLIQKVFGLNAKAEPAPIILPSGETEDFWKLGDIMCHTNNWFEEPSHMGKK